MVHVNAQEPGAAQRFLLIGLLAIFAVAITPTPSLAFGNWSSTGSMNVARDGHRGVMLSNGEVLVTGGENNTTGYLSSAEIYSPSTGKWTLTGNMTIARYGHNAVLF